MPDLTQTKESLQLARDSLKAETQAIVQVSNVLNDNLGKAVTIIWRQLLFIWAVVIVLSIPYFMVLGNAPPATNLADMDQISQPHPGAPPEPTRPSQSALTHSPPLPNCPEVPEKTDLLELLNQIREAQFKKDIHLFLGAYSPAFPDLKQKRESTLNIWRRYDYLGLEFQVCDLEQKDISTLLGKVTWKIKARDHKTDEVKILSRCYNVTFSKESGKWLIKNIELIGGKEARMEHIEG